MSRYRRAGTWLAALLLAPGALVGQGTDGIRIAPEHHGSYSIAYFVSHEDAAQRDEFHSEGRLSFAFAPVGFGENRLLWVHGFLGLWAGRQPEGLGIDPSYVDISFGIAGEWRLDGTHLWAGLDRGSFHRVDRLLDESIWYWKFSAAAGSPDLPLLHDPWEAPFAGPRARDRRIGWQLFASWYPRSLWVLDENAVSEGHPWRWDARLALRGTILEWRQVGIHLHSRSGVAKERSGDFFAEERLDGDAYGFQTFAIEAALAGEHSVSLSLAANVADGRRSRFRRRGLVQLTFGAAF